MTRRPFQLMLGAALALGLGAGATHAQQRGIRAVDRTQQADTLVLVLHLDGEPATHVSEPFHADGRVRLFIDLNESTGAPDSAALAALQGENLIALHRRERTGGIALVVDLKQLADYRVLQTDSTLQLRILERAAVAAPAPTPGLPPSQASAAPPQEGAATPYLLLAVLPAVLLLGAVWRRRTPDPAEHGNAGEGTIAGVMTSPANGEDIRNGGRLWAVRTLAASGASTADVVRRTGMPRDAIRFLESATPAAVGSNYRHEPASASAPRRTGTE